MQKHLPFLQGKVDERGDDLVDRHFVMQSARHQGWFCGKCGKRIIPDLYNAGKHAESCGFTVSDTGESRNVAVDHEPGYRLSAKEGNLHLEICFPELVNIPGFQDRFRKMRWVPVMETVFCPDRRDPVIAGNSSGIDLSLWLSLIRAGKCCRIQRELDVEVIREVFPGIIGLYSLQMFVHIYCTKGFRHSRLLPEHVARRVLMSIPMEDRTNIREKSSSSLEWSSRARAGRRAVRPLRAALLRGKGDIQFLRLTIENGEGRRWPSFLFSRGYAACTPGLDIWQILQGDYELTADSEGAVRRFAQLYPEYNLEQYLEKSSNILIPLIAPDYHSLLEIAAKAGAPAVAENMAELSQFKQDPAMYTNLRDAFRLPLHVLRTLEPEDVNEELIKKFASINLCNPGFLQFDRYTQGMLDFYMCLWLPAPTGNVAGRTGRIEAGTRRTGVRRTGRIEAYIQRNGVRRAGRIEAGTQRNEDRRTGIHSAENRIAGTQDTESRRKGMRAAETRKTGALKRGERFPGGERRYRGVVLERDLTDTQVLQILRYLYKHLVSWELLRDYLNACELLGEYPYGFIPKKISLLEAHDRVVQRIELKKGDLERDSFRQIVWSEKYLSLTTYYSDEDKELFEEEAFVIIPPKEKKDLFMESEAMHNCVRIYSSAVVRGSCMIYFLRRKEKPGTSYGTIEVRGNTLVQAKGFANSRLEQPAQDFIRKWCATKHLDIRTRDIENLNNE